ncbi:MAG: DNA repair protein RecO, partial [Rikenellaceae bacterium]
MAEYYKTRGIVLHTIPHGESGHIVYMYTEAWGRLSYYVNSGKRGVATVGGSKVMLHPLTMIELVGTKSNGSFHRIKEAKRAVVSTAIFTDVYKSTISLFLSELIYKVVKEDEANPMLFDFLYQSITLLDMLEEGKANFHLFFTLQLTRYLGFYPNANYE